MDGDLHSDLRESIDEAGADVGAAVADDIPETPAAVRDALPDDLTELLDDVDGEQAATLRSAVEPSPIGRYLERFDR